MKKEQTIHDQVWVQVANEFWGRIVTPIWIKVLNHHVEDLVQANNLGINVNFLSLKGSIRAQVQDYFRN